MQSIIVTSQKGGSGKSTLARNLAAHAGAQGMRVLCIDLDPQQTLREWWKAREADTPQMLSQEPTPETLAETLAKASDLFDLAVIDTPPAAPEWLSGAVAACDLALIPVRPSPDDLRAIGATIRLVQGQGVPFAFVLSQTPPRASITGEAVRVLAQHGRVAPVNLVSRVSYAEAGATGQAVTETSDAKAASEIAELWIYVNEILETRANG